MARQPRAFSTAASVSGVPVGVDRGASDRVLLEGERDLGASGGGLEHAARLLGDLRADPVARKQQYAMHRFLFVS